VSLVDRVSSQDSQRSSRNSLQALYGSRYCIPSTRFNRGDAGILARPGRRARLDNTDGPGRWWAGVRARQVVGRGSPWGTGCDDSKRAALSAQRRSWWAPHQLAAHQRLTHLSPRETQHPRSHILPSCCRPPSAGLLQCRPGDLLPACLPAVPASSVAPVTPRTAPAASRPAPQAQVQQRGLRRLEWVRGWPLVQRAPHVLRQPASQGLCRQQLQVLHLQNHKISDSPGIPPLKWS
jgi:hypothetical protein